MHEYAIAAYNLLTKEEPNQMYCPKCKSKLYPADKQALIDHGVCSYLVAASLVWPIVETNDSPKKYSIEVFNREKNSANSQKNLS